MPPLTPVRRRFLQFMTAVALVHVVAIVLYYTLGISEAAPSRQRTFAWIWMGATVVAVLVGLQRLKRARRRGGGRQ